MTGLRKLNMFKRILIIFIILASFQMFSFTFIPEGVLKIIGLAGVVVIVITILLQLIYSPLEHFILNFKWEILLILIAVFTSMFMANSSYNQGFSTTLIAQRYMYYYLIYYMLHLVKIPDYDLEKIIIGFAVIYAAFYILQYFAYPTRLFNVRVSQDRGTIRIFQAGLAFLIIAYFMMLNHLFKEFSLLKLAALLFFVSIFFLMATRQLIIAVLVVSVANVLLSKQIKSKILIIFLITVATVPLIIMFQDMIMNLITLSQKQSSNFQENIRVLAATFFLSEFFPNNLAYITGNGADSTNSSYGLLIQMYKNVYGFYQSDIGIIGDYSKFGLFFLLGVILILVKALKAKINSNLSYIKYFFVLVILISFTGGGFFGNSADSIVAISILLYIIDVNLFRNQTQTLETNPGVDKDSEIQIV